MNALDAFSKRMMSSSRGLNEEGMDDCSCGSHHANQHNSMNHSFSHLPWNNRRQYQAPERFRGALEVLSPREEDLKMLLEQEGGLESLKISLRQQGAVTNSLIKQGLHLYVRDNKSRRDVAEAVAKTA